MASDISFSSTSYVNVLSFSATVGQSGKLLVRMTSSARANASTYPYYRLNRGSGTQLVFLGGGSSGGLLGGFAGQYLFEGLAPGAHSFVLQARIPDGNTLYITAATKPEEEHLRVVCESW